MWEIWFIPIISTSSVTLAMSLKQQTKQQHRDRQRKLGRQQQKKS